MRDQDNFHIPQKLPRKEKVTQGSKPHPGEGQKQGPGAQQPAQVDWPARKPTWGCRCEEAWSERVAPQTQRQRGRCRVGVGLLNMLFTPGQEMIESRLFTFCSSCHSRPFWEQCAFATVLRFSHRHGGEVACLGPWLYETTAATEGQQPQGP